MTQLHVAPEDRADYAAAAHARLCQLREQVSHQAAVSDGLGAAFYMLNDLSQGQPIAGANPTVNRALVVLMERELIANAVGPLANDYVISLRYLKELVDEANAICDVLAELTGADETDPLIPSDDEGLMQKIAEVTQLATAPPEPPLQPFGPVS